MAIKLPPALARRWGIRDPEAVDAVALQLCSFRALQGFCIGGGIDVAAGDVVTLPLSEARLHVGAGRLEQLSDPPKRPRPTPAGKVQSRDPAPTSREPEPTDDEKPSRRAR